MAGIPRQIGPEAEEVAVVIDKMMEQLLTEAGLPRVNRTGATVKSIAQLVQWAIDTRMERMDA